MNKPNLDTNLNKKALVLSILFSLILMLIHFITVYFNYFIIDYGIYPLNFNGLKGVFLSPFIHSSWKHVISNSIALIPLIYFLFFYYKNIFFKVIILIFLISGFWTWIIGRPSYHVGASGLVNGLVAFLFFSGVFRKHKKLMGVSLLMVFIYGSILWGMFPSSVLSWFLNDDVVYIENISWEAHLSGVISGLILAYFFKGDGLQKDIFYFDDSDLDDESPYWLD
jgi:membrane associated rhomboid family serine protease